MTMPNARKAADGRSIGLVLAALAALGWGAAFYAVFQNVETRSSANQTIAQLEGENARLAALVDASAQIDAVEVQIRAAREELVAVLDHRRDLEDNIATLHTDLVALNGAPVPAVTGSMPDGDSSQARASQLNAALARLDRTIAQRSSELSGIERLRQGAETRLKAASEAAAEIDRMINERSQGLSAAEQRLSSLLADNARLDQLNERRNADLAQLAESEARALRQVEAAQEEIEGLALRRVELGDEVARLEASIAENAAVGAEIAAQKARLASLREEVAREDARLGQNRRQLSDLQAQINTSQAELRRLQSAAPPAPGARPSVEDRPDGSRVIRVRPPFN